MFDRTIIFTDANGRPLPRPDRADYPAGIEGTILCERARCAYWDRVRSLATKAFTQQFVRALRAK
jgi:hypothetical protein